MLGQKKLQNNRALFANQGDAEQLHSDGILNNPGFHNNIR